MEAAAASSLPGLEHAHAFYLVKQYRLHDAMTTDPRAFHHTDCCFTYVIGFELHSAAEDERVEVGLLEDLVKGRFVLKLGEVFVLFDLIQKF